MYRLICMLCVAASLLIAASPAMGVAQPGSVPTTDLPEQAQRGSVIFLITIRGEIEPADDFRFALDTVPPGRIIEPIIWICGPEGPWSPVPLCRADREYVRDSGEWPAGTVLRYGLGMGDSGFIAALSGTVTISATTQIYRLTYDYGLRSLPNTALPAPEAWRPRR